MDNYEESPTLKNYGAIPQESELKNNVSVFCGWGRLLFANTFSSLHELAEELQNEKSGQRDLAFYVRDPHLVLSEQPDTLFLDPSSSYRLHLNKVVTPRFNEQVAIRLMTPDDLNVVNKIYEKASMLTIDSDKQGMLFNGPGVSYWVAEDVETHSICAVCLVLNHKTIFNDPENGLSLWSLAVDIQSPVPGIGNSFMVQLINHYKNQSFQYLDLSVLKENKDALSMYKKLGFKRTGVFCVKRKNAINEKFFVSNHDFSLLNPYSKILVEEAMARGIQVDILDRSEGIIDYRFGGRKIRCWESLSELTNAIALHSCQNKHITHKLLSEANLKMPNYKLAHTLEEAETFLNSHKSIVVKPDNGEQGKGVSLDVQTTEALHLAYETAKQHGDLVLLESFHQGIDCRIVVINFEVIAAAIRLSPRVTGDGIQTIENLIKKQSRRRAALTGGESQIPIDGETVSQLSKLGFKLNDVLPSGETIIVRKPANLHQGGTIHDVTSKAHPHLKEVAVQASKVLNIPVVGLDLMIEAVDKPDCVIIEANERPGLANHEPQPTAEKFIDFLFPNCPRRT